MTTWRKGPPPSIGWWPASWWQDEKVFRWWDGKRWSHPADAGFNAQQAAAEARKKEKDPEYIEWTDRPAWWPERSRT
jgi:hypothetical protein